MFCEDIMTTEIISNNENDTIYSVAKNMQANNIGIIPILNNENKLVGAITDRDIVTKIIANKIDVNESVANFMERNIVCVYDKEDISIAISKMADYQIKRIFILNNHNNLIGIISLKDLASYKETFPYLNDLFREISLDHTLVKPIKYFNQKSQTI